tara:strand:+ start:141 stop:242 length:102 start_codon:yes stop_codon:yes gene_type:complete
MDKPKFIKRQSLAVFRKGVNNVLGGLEFTLIGY